MNMKTAVVFDLDDVVAMMREQTHKVFEKMSGKRVLPEDWHTFCPIELYGVDFCPDTMAKEMIMEKCQPEPDALTCFQTIRNLGHKIIVVTARGWHEDGFQITQDWFQKFGIVYDELYVISGYNKDMPTKTQAFDAIGEKYRIVAFLDDQPKYIAQGNDHDLVENVFIFNRPWNQSVEGQRVDSLTHFCEKVLEITKERKAS